MTTAHLETHDARWSRALQRLPYDFYHRPDYVRLDAEVQGAEPAAFLAADGGREFFLPYLLRRCDALFPDAPEAADAFDIISPYGYPGIALSEAARQSPEFVREAVDRLRGTLRERGVCSAFLRMNPLLSEGLDGLLPADVGIVRSDSVAMDLTVDDRQLWKNIREGHQYTINKCRRQGFEARIGTLGEHLDAFMEIYRQTMDRVHARDAYYFERGYFEALAEMPDGVHCGVVESEGDVVAACVFFECGGIVQAHLGGTRYEFLKRSPFHLLLFHAAGWAKARGNRFLHIGGGVGGSNDQLLHFKRGFSPALFPFLKLHLVTDEEKCARLTEIHAAAENVPVEQLTQTGYFPAYRAPVAASPAPELVRA
jgi:hypothetical protein